MGSWKKRLRTIASDPRPVNYSYEDLSSVLKALGFKEFGAGSSHRTWKLQRDGKPALRVSLVDKGAGTVKAVYVKNMVAALAQAGLIPADDQDH